MTAKTWGISGLRRRNICILHRRYAAIRSYGAPMAALFFEGNDAALKKVQKAHAGNGRALLAV